MRAWRNFRVTLAVLLLAAGGALPAAAGSITLAWDASADATGYKVYYGTSSGSYTRSRDVGNVTETTLTDLTDCTTWYFVVTATNAAGESGYSNEVPSFPRPVVQSITPSLLEKGRQADVTVDGTNFQAGDSVEFSEPRITVNSSTVRSCNQIAANITVGSDAASGAKDVSVSHANGVRGTGTGLLTVVDPVVPPPVVSNVRRADKK